jgi:hypothetical protein
MSLNANSPAKQQQREELEKLCDEYSRHAIVMSCQTCGVPRRYAREHVLANKLRCFHCGGYRLKPES